MLFLWKGPGAGGTVDCRTPRWRLHLRRVRDLCKDVLSEDNVQITFTTDPNVTPEAARISSDLRTLQRRLAASVDLLAQLTGRIGG